MNRHEHLVARYLDGELTPEETLELSSALEGDPRAADEFAEMFRQSRALEALHWQEDPAAGRAIMDELLDARHPFVRGVMQDVEIKPHRSAQMHWPPWLSFIRSWSLRKWVAEFFSRPRWALVTVAGVAFLCCAWFFYYGVTIGQPKLELAESSSIDVVRNGMVTRARRGFALRAGDVLNVSGTNAATISFAPEKTRITNWPGTELKLVSVSGAKRFILGAGKIEASVGCQRKFKPMVIWTPQAEARVLGTEFRMVVDTESTHLEVTEGKVRLTRTSDGAAVKVTAGHSSIAATNAELAALPATGHILREYWTNYTGNFTQLMTADPTLAARPDGWDYLERFESKPLQPGVRFGERVRGFVHPPKTGWYRFSVTKVHVEAALHLSRSDKPAEVVHIADRGPAPESGGSSIERVTPVPLQAGKKYYIEIVHESDGGEDRLTIMWHAPGRDPEIIPGKFLSPSEPKNRAKKR